MRPFASYHFSPWPWCYFEAARVVAAQRELSEGLEPNYWHLKVDIHTLAEFAAYCNCRTITLPEISQKPLWDYSRHCGVAIQTALQLKQFRKIWLWGRPAMILKLFQHISYRFTTSFLFKIYDWSTYEHTDFYYFFLIYFFSLCVVSGVLLTQIHYWVIS